MRHDTMRVVPLLPFLLTPIWLLCYLVSRLLGFSERTHWFGHYLAYCSTAALLGVAVGDVAAWLFVRLICGSMASYSCLHAYVLFGFLGDLGGLILGISVGTTYARKRALS
jgi:hypothetical protein